MKTSSLVPVLETERLVLRGHRLADFEDSAAMWADPKVVAHISGVPSTAAESWSRVLRYIGHWQALGYGYWVIESKIDGAFLGEAGLADYHRDTQPSVHGKPEAGWALKTSAQGQGLATEAVTAVMDWADKALSSEFPMACAIFDPAHAGSVRVAEKIGFGNPVMGSFKGHKALFLERALGTLLKGK
ncbi:GNAT family N-acetyltransferase [Shimia sagamensis]|uniref:Protein N-acetyltransferase, RimJ/RimL family n=1 Tax=Shimia sagamensis TaxID=1566352 RepID=A0ABY1P994_9RHOB|nr:GNAT family N-acetyltransferase [Shimia sagamensis]SMP29192.1 Protein N-acetyltransferase, RimJ/RimL family [Shimia sagamensis]